MNRLVAFLSISVIAACSGDEGDKADTKCPELGALQCNGNKLEECQDDGTWEFFQDCAANNLVCTESGNNPRCAEGGGGNGCDMSTFEVVDSYSDTDVRLSPGYQTAAGYATDNTYLYEIEIENYLDGYPGHPPGTTGTVQLTGAQTNYATCGVCVMGTVYDSDFNVVKRLIGMSGSVEFVAWGEVPGDAFDFILHGVNMREVTINSSTFQSTPVTGGDTWCMDGVEIAGTNTAPYCLDGQPVGGSYCALEDTLATCVDDPDGGHLEPTVCGSTQGCAVTSDTNFIHECADICTVAGQVTCDVDTVRTCTDLTLDDVSTKYAITTEACADVCTADSNPPSCVESCTVNGNTRCAAGDLETCNGTYWVASDCGTETCYDTTPTTDDNLAGCYTGCSTNGLTQCNGTVRETCNGTHWTQGTDCAGTGDVCEELAASTRCTDTCTGGENGQVRCTSDYVETCNGAGWILTTDCSATSQTCQSPGGTPGCWSMSCTSSGDERCYGNVVQTCNGATWDNSTTCGAYQACVEGAMASAACEAATCTSGAAAECNGDVIMTCTDVGGGDFRWTAGTDCAATTGFECFENPAASCQEACTVGATRCATGDTELQTCNSAGYWGTPTPCASGCSGNPAACN